MSLIVPPLCTRVTVALDRQGGAAGEQLAGHPARAAD